MLKYAINSFEACSLDYLVKPIELHKLQAVINRYHLWKNRGAAEQMQELFRNDMQPAGSLTPNTFL